jgi:hypothetical protein
MNCPNCGAFAYEDNIGRWFCSQSCGWNSGYTYTMGDRNGLSELWRKHSADPYGRVAVRELRLAIGVRSGADGGTFAPCAHAPYLKSRRPTSHVLRSRARIAEGVALKCTVSTVAMRARFAAG